MNPPESPYGQADAEPRLEKPSKSARKRNMHRLQEFAEILCLLNVGQIGKAPISEQMLLGVQDFQETKSHEGKRRQAQYLGKLMREEDGDAIESFLTGLERTGQIKKGTLKIWEQR